MPCIAPSEIVTTPTAAAFGLIAEQFIGREYLIYRRKVAYFPASRTDFQDISAGFGNSTLHIAFLKALNPRVSVSKLLFMSASGLLKVPDLITHDSRVTEFYEIKPNSFDGRLAGQAKVAALSAAYSSLNVPYTSGNGWNPDVKREIYSGLILGAQVKVYFHYFRTIGGLLLYDLCIEGELGKLAFHVLLAILALIIIIILRRGVIIPPVPAPALPQVLA